MRVLVTGANGFVGSALCRGLSRHGHMVRGAVRSKEAAAASLAVPVVALGEIDEHTDWAAALVGMEVVVHLAARVHVLRDTVSDPLAACRAVNVTATKHLAQLAAKIGMKRFVYVSSIKVNGEETSLAPFTEEDLPEPQDPYGVSKFEAEQVLLKIGQETGMEIVILRPPLVYGPGVRANFLRLMNWVERGVPLPLALVKNARSLLYLGNLVDAIVVSVEHPAAAGKIFLLADGEAISTPELIRHIGRALGRPARLWPMPEMLLRLVGRLVGKTAEVERLLGALEVDGSKIRRDLGWLPPFTLDEGLHKTAEWYHSEKRRLDR